MKGVIPLQEPTPATECQRKIDVSNGQNWYECERCGSIWHDLVQGVNWLPLSCVNREFADKNGLMRKSKIKKAMNKDRNKSKTMLAHKRASERASKWKAFFKTNAS